MMNAHVARLGFVAALLAVPARAQIVPQRPSRDWAPADRTVIGDFTRVTSIAAASDRVFMTSATALLVWRPQVQRWEGPFEPPEPGTLDQTFAALVDPLDNSLWLARPDGFVHFQPDFGAWTRGTSTARVTDIAFDATAPFQGLYLRTVAGWQLVPRGGFSAIPTAPPARPVGPTSVPELLRSNPTLQANAAQILRDARLRDVQFTAAARAFDRRGWFIGTSGRGMLFLPEGAALPQPLSFGLSGGVVGSVFSAPGGVWAANDRTPTSEAGLTFVASDLSEFTTLQGPAATGLPFGQSRAMKGQDAFLWLATDRGLVRVEPGTGRIRLFGEAVGLPDSRVISLSTRFGQITAGTLRGLVRIDDSLRVHPLSPSFAEPVTAVLVATDTVWAGTEHGLLFATSDSAPVGRPDALNAPSLQGAVAGLAWLGDTLVVMTTDQLMWRAPYAPWSLGPLLSSTMGRLRRLVADGNGFWIAGDRGLAYARLNSAALRPMFAGDIPGDIYDLAIDPDYLWIATSNGLVRFRLDAIRP